MTAGIPRRWIASVASQTYVRAGLFLNALAVVPLMLHAWGVAGYGAWLTANAIASYLSLSNFGLPSAAGTDILQAYGAKDFDRASYSFRMAISALCFVILPITLITVFAVFFLPFGSGLDLGTMGSVPFALTLALLALSSWVGSVKSIFAAAVAANGYFGSPNFVSGTVKFIELGAVLFVVLEFAVGPPQVAGVMLASAVLDMIAIAFLARRLVPWTKNLIGPIDLKWLKGLMAPSFGTLVLGLTSNNLLIQAPRLILSVTAGAPAVAAYGVYTAAIRSVDQITSLVADVFYLELARSFGANLRDRVLRLVAVGTQFGLFSFIVVAAILLFAGSAVFDAWTGGKVEFDYEIFLVFLTAGLALQIGNTFLRYLISANQLLIPSLQALAGVCLGLCIGWALARSWGVVGMALGTMVGEFGRTALMIRAASKSLQLRKRDILQEVFDFPATLRRVGEILRLTWLRRSA